MDPEKKEIKVTLIPEAISSTQVAFFRSSQDFFWGLGVFIFTQEAWEDRVHLR